MRWIAAFILIGGSSFFLYTRFAKQAQPPKADVPAPAALKLEPAPFLSVEELKRVRKSTRDGDAGVRWSSLELLFTFRDPESVKLLEKAIADDPDPELKMKAIKLLASTPNPDRIPALVKGLQDTDREVRLASLAALGQLADASASPWVVEALKDPEPDVKRAALDTLSKFHDKRREQFRELSEKLRVQYEAEVRRAKKEREFEN